MLNSFYYQGSSVPTVRILVNGKPIKQYVDEKNQVWIEAKEGSKYSIEINNTSSNRILAVPSVDGINVITGEPAELKAEDGYVIRAYSKTVIDGWRISDEKVKEFLFTFNKDQSYSVKLGNGKANLGVIGIALYAEKQDVLWRTFAYNGTTSKGLGDFYSGGVSTCDSAAYNCSVTNLSASSDNITLTSCSVSGPELTSAGNPIGTRSLKRSAVDFQAGTGKGKEVESSVTEVSFTPGELIATQNIYYDSYKNLIKRGIVVKEPAMPQPFKQTKYCKDI